MEVALGPNMFYLKWNNNNNVHSFYNLAGMFPLSLN